MNLMCSPICRLHKTKPILLSHEFKRMFWGDGYISGKVLEGVEPKIGAVIELYECETKQFVKATTTNLVGEYRFDDIDRTRYFDVIAVDQNAYWEKKISSYRRPKHDLRPQFTANDGGMVAIFIDNEPFYEGGFGEEVYIPAIDTAP